MLINLNEKININKENKIEYGEVFTPFLLIQKMFDLLKNFPKDIFKNKNLKWLDTGAGTGNFSIYLYNELNEGLKDEIKDAKIRKEHIIKNMIYMIEINNNNIMILKDKFGENSNIYNTNYLDYIVEEKFDIIIGNPPYNSKGLKKTPTNNINNKKEDGKMIWMDFTKKSISLLKDDGLLLYIIPSIWMKPDKNNNYYYLLNYKINNLHTLTNTETNKIFNGNAQTPTCYFLLSKKENDNFINLYDKCLQKYINYKIILGKPIPLFGQSIIFKLQSYVNKYGYLKVIKTNSPSKKSKFSNIYDEINYSYKNITTCLLKKTQPILIYNYSNIPQAYHKDKKIILSHKMYGFPYIDYNGEIGISNRDNYVIINYTIDELEKIKAFLSTKIALYIYEATRYRMKYLEKYAFELIPDIIKILDFPKEINDNTIADYFQINNEERNAINKLHKKEYLFF